jgi:hypothetical protein
MNRFHDCSFSHSAATGQCTADQLYVNWEPTWNQMVRVADKAKNSASWLDAALVGAKTRSYVGGLGSRI